MIIRILYFIWPHVNSLHSDDTLRDDIARIDAASFASDGAMFLEEARRLRDIETNRKESADTKSQIYLAALFAIIPILVSLTEGGAVMGNLNFSKWYEGVGLFFFLLGILYGIGAFVSSFRALSVRGFHRIDIENFLSASTAPAANEQFAKGILRSVRRDREIINNKVSYVTVTHRLLFRMALAIILALSMVSLMPMLIDFLGALIEEVCRS